MVRSTPMVLVEATTRNRGDVRTKVDVLTPLLAS